MARTAGWRKYQFFKILVGDFSQYLRVPPDFVQRISPEMSRTKRAMLEGPDGGAWRVEVERKMGRGMFLTGGWGGFVRGNGLKEFQFVVFRYEGNARFSVRVFDTSGCEAVYAAEGRKRGTRSTAGVGCGGVLQLKASTVSRRHRGRADAAQIGKLALARGFVKVEERKDGIFLERQAVSLDETEQARTAANLFSSRSPYFIKNMAVNNVCKAFVLRIPQHFCGAYLPKKKENLILLDPEGREWVVHFIPGGPIKNYICGGWCGFTRGNALEIGDHCVFELIAPLKLRVHIFRARKGDNKKHLEDL